MCYAVLAQLEVYCDVGSGCKALSVQAAVIAPASQTAMYQLTACVDKELGLQEHRVWQVAGRSSRVVRLHAGGCSKNKNTLNERPTTRIIHMDTLTLRIFFRLSSARGI